MIRVFSISLFVLLLLGCDKPDAPDCFKKGGKVVIIDRELSLEVNAIMVFDQVDVILEDAEIPSISVEGPENLLSKVETRVDGDLLIIENLNTCNWIRGEQPSLVVRVSHPQIKELTLESQGEITSANTLQWNPLKIEINDQSDDVRLSLNCESLEILNHAGLANIVIDGQGDFFEVFHQGVGLFNAEDFNASTVLINQSSINDLYIRSENYVSAEIFGSGNLHIFGSPSTIEDRREGSGEIFLIP